ncbi:MAG TPA: hypothetical protein VE911_06945 [Candidatus Nitrosopolaris sp.]|nr:hypothetical protein [Candidatus Nitrosopolaris sp.]
MTIARIAASLLLAAFVSACAPRPLLREAIRARGGPLHAFVREVETEVQVEFPGLWRLRVAYLEPDHYAWTVFTAGEPDFYLFDGTTQRAFVGTRAISVEPASTAPLRSPARFTAAANLDALLLPGVQVTPLPPGALPPEAANGLTAVFADDGSRYVLVFDTRQLLVHAEGPLSLPPLGSGTVSVRFADYRRTRRWWLPYRAEYAFAGRLLATETTLSLCPDDPELTPDAFRSPSALPACTEPRSASPG